MKSILSKAVKFFTQKKQSSKIIFSEKIASDAHNNVVLLHDGIPIPPIIMRDKVRRSAVLAEDFIIEGQQAFQAIQNILEKNGVNHVSDSRVFEFGVGCGRIARHFIRGDIESFTGCDVDEQLASWCTDILSKEDSRFIFFKNDYLPPLPVEKSSFDLVYSISVFTHMDRGAQIKWLAEITRIVKPGGFFLISIIEEEPDNLPSGIKVKERVDPEYKRGWFGVGGAPEIYYSTANTESYITSILADEFELLAKHSKAVRGRQSLLLYRKR